MLAQSIIPEPEIPKDFYKLVRDLKLALLGCNTGLQHCIFSVQVLRKVTARIPVQVVVVCLLVF